MKPNKKILLKRILVLCLAMFMVFGDVYSNSHLIMQVEAKSKPAAKPPAKPAPFINHNQNDVISKMFWKNLHTLFYTLDKMIKIDDIIRGQGTLVQEYFKDNEGKEWSYILIANDNDDEVLKSIFENLTNGLKQIDITLVEAV